jgi:hypothetical protein
MNTGIQTIPLLICALLAGACTTEPIEDQLGYETSTGAAALTSETRAGPSAKDVVRDAVQLHQELVDRLESRGYTTADALAAAEAGDEARARELFGYTEMEYEALGARMEAIAVAVEEAERDGSWPALENQAADPEGLDCNWGQAAACAYGLGGVSIGFRIAGAGWPLVLAYAVGAGGICTWANCRWERDGSGTSPGTRTKPK